MTIQDAPALVIHVFGTCRVCRNGEPIPKMRTRKETWLLALLMLHAADKPVERSRLAGMLWPEASESAALHNLRRSLSVLKSALGTDGDRIFSPTPRTLQIDPANAFCDLIAFDVAIAQGDSESLAEAIKVYRGPLMQDCQEEWIVHERETRGLAALTALEALAQQKRESGDLPEAVEYLRRALELDPFCETALRSLISTFAAQGRHAAAGEEYRVFRQRLYREMNAEPDPETMQLSRQIQADARTAAATFATAPSALPPTPAFVGKAPFNLPLAINPLIGRKKEIHAVLSLLNSARLVTLIGTGGVGKTRLGLAVAEAVSSEFSDGVFFVDLAALADGKLLTLTVLSCLSLKEESERTHVETLVNFVQTRCLLLVLDNCEHLREDCAQFSQMLLLRSPRLQILATSREPLHMTAESVWPTPGLASGEAIELFTERARQVNQAFQITGDNAAAVDSICRRLDCMPLAIEMAAARVRGMSVYELDRALADVLRAYRLLNVPGTSPEPRHQTLSAILDWSYGLLEQAEKRLLARVSVFPGGWTIAAVEAVCADDSILQAEILFVLLSLVDKSLVVYSENAAGEGRYRLLETTWLYASEQLPDHERERLNFCLLHYLKALVDEARPHWGQPDESSWMDRLENELPSIRAVLEQAIRNPGEIFGTVPLQLATSLFRMWWRRGHITEGRRYLESLLSLESSDANTELRAAALNALGVLVNYQRDTDSALTYHREALAIRRGLGDKRGIAVSLHNIAVIYGQVSESASARDIFRECSSLYHELGDESRSLASALHADEMSMVMTGQGEGYPEFEERWLHERKRAELRDDRLLISMIEGALGTSAARLRRVDAALHHTRRYLILRKELGDRVGVINALETIGPLLGPSDTARLFAVAARQREEIGSAMLAANRQAYEEHLARSRAELGNTVFEEIWALGRTMTTEQAVEYALRARSESGS